MKQNHDLQRRLQLPLVRLGPFLLLLSLILLTSCGDRDSQTGVVSPATAEAWLALMDNGKFAKSWETAAECFRQAVTQADWVAMAKQVREPLGAVISRKVKTTKETDTLPGMPDGSYFVAEFNTSFAGLPAAAETVTLTQEKNGEWKVAGYLVTVDTGDEAVTSLLQPIQQKFAVPAMAAAVVTSAGIEFIGVVGVRKRGTDIPVALDDHWHLGSDTKAMTSVLIARLVERGQLKWDTTLAEVFPDLAPLMHADFRKVTLLHLLSHRAGLPPNLNLPKYTGDDVLALRLRAVQEELAKKPQSPPGSKYVYSNLGYIIAGAVVEKVTSKSWEQLMSSEIFAPLQMKTAGFGGTGRLGEIDQPWPHTADGQPTPVNGPAMDNLPVMGPAGRVHCSIQDWAKFIRNQLRGARGEPALLKPDSYQKLHTPPFGGDYALGWLAVKRSWGGGTVLNHAGDNTMNFATVWIAPQRDFAILVCVNQSGDAAAQAADAAVVALMKLHNEKHPAK